MAEIALSRGMVALVDDRDEEALRAFRWSARPASNIPGGWYAFRTVPEGTVYLHRQIMGLGRGGPEVDHINGNGLDNRRANLRLATRSQNHANKGKPRGVYTSRFKGVSWSRERRRWCAYIKVGRRSVLVGRFRDEVEAAVAHDLAALATWGEFARLNFPSTVHL